MKKLFVVALTLVMALTVTACGGSTPSSTGETTKPSEADTPAAYPTEAVRVIVPYAAGGNTDLNARAVANIVESNKLMSQSMVVTNMPGSNCMDATAAVMKATPNAQTLYCNHTAHMAFNATGTAELMYTELEPVIEIATSPFCVVANTQCGLKTVEEVVEYAKAHPGELSMAYVNVGSTTHFTTLEFLKESGLADYITLVNYPSGAEALTAQLSNEVQLRGSVGSDAARYITSGDLVCLCVSTSADGPVWEGIDTWADLGWDVDFYMSQGFWTTKGSPASSVQALYDIVAEACQTEEYAQFCLDNGMTPAWTNGSEWSKTLDSLYATCQDIVASGLMDIG